MNNFVITHKTYNETRGINKLHLKLNKIFKAITNTKKFHLL